MLLAGCVTAGLGGWLWQGFASRIGVRMVDLVAVNWVD